MAVGQLIMLGTLIGLIILIFGLVLYFDPDARRRGSAERLCEEQTAGDGHSR
jgi:hypothetical protein